MKAEPNTPDIPEDIRDRMRSDGYSPNATDMIHSRMRYEHARHTRPKLLPNGLPNSPEGYGFMKEAPFGAASERRIDTYGSQHAYRMAMYHMLERHTRLALIALDKTEADKLTTAEYCQARVNILKLDPMYPAIMRVLTENGAVAYIDFDFETTPTTQPPE